MACGPRRGLGTTGQADSPVWRDTVESKKPSAWGSILTEGSLHSRAFGSPSRAVGPRLWSGGCAGSGHAREPPSSVMNSRRLNSIRFPTSQVEWQDIELARISQRVCELRTDTPKVRVDFAERTLRNILPGLAGSLRLDVRRPDHLAPLLGFVGDEPPEITWRATEDNAAEVGQLSLQLGIGEAGVDLLAELADDLGRYVCRALAVCMLITNSNLVDCKTGRSAGLAPLRIWPV